MFLKRFLLFGCLSTGLWGQAQTLPKAPNIIYIYADDLGYGELGAYGQRLIQTPHLDRMAREGIRFTQHYTSAPVCAPARAMLMTGKHSGHSYIRGNYELGGFEDSTEGGQMPLPEGSFTIAHLMKQAGYATAIVGKWGLGMTGNSGHPNLQGFDYFYGYLDQKQSHNFYPTHLWENQRWDTLQNPPISVHQPPAATDTGQASYDRYKGKEYAVDKMTEKAVGFIRRNQHRPFFLYLPYTLPHVSLQAPDSLVNAYVGRFSETPYRGQKGYAACRYPKSTYAAMITCLDTQVGKILELLKELKLDDNTLVMFSSDNGTTFNVGGVEAEYFNSVGPLRGRKQDLYEGGIRMPFIARWPGRIPAARVSDHISAQYDLMATLAELSQQRISPRDGISFLPTLLGNPQTAQHEFLYFEFPEKSGQVAVRIGKWKGVKSNLKANPRAAWELYDLEADLGEQTDVSASHPTIIARMEAILQREHHNAHIRDWEFINNKAKK
jgi:arylsulfatase A